MIRVFAVLPLLLLACPARADEVLTAQVMRALAQIPIRHAMFTEQKRLAALTTVLVSSGELFYRRPDYLEKRTIAPAQETLAANGDMLTLTSGGGAPPRVIDLKVWPPLRAMIEVLRAPLAGDAGALQHAFTLRSEGSLALWRLTLTPKNAQGARFVRYVTLDGAGADMTRIDLAQANGDEQILTIRPAASP